MANVDLSGLENEVADRVLALWSLALQQGISITLTSAFRTGQRQRELYNAWLARGRRGLPAAFPGTSTHEYGLAVDLTTPREADYPRLGRLAECVGLKWAGPRDKVHFDVFGPRAWRQALQGKRPVVSYQRC